MSRILKSVVAAVALGAALLGTCGATDYDPQLSNIRVYRIALGSGTAPSAADMIAQGIRPGDMVINTDDNVLYLMHATNKYTKFTAAGNVTLAGSLNMTNVTLGGGAVLANESAGAVDVRFNNLNVSNLLTLTLKSTAAYTNVADGDRMWLRFVAENDSDEAVDYASIEGVVSDVTTNTEDGSIRFYVAVNGTEDTLRATLNSDGLTVVGTVAATALSGGGQLVTGLNGAYITNGLSAVAQASVYAEMSHLTGTTYAAGSGAALTDLNAANLTVKSVASAIDGSAITNLNAANMTVKSVAPAIDGSAVTNLTAANIAAAGTLPQLNGAALTALNAANVTVGSVASAFDGAAVTNLTAANVATVGAAGAVTSRWYGVAVDTASCTTNVLITYPFGGSAVVKQQP